MHVYFQFSYQIMHIFLFHGVNVLSLVAYCCNISIDNMASNEEGQTNDDARH